MAPDRITEDRAPAHAALTLAAILALASSCVASSCVAAPPDDAPRPSVLAVGFTHACVLREGEVHCWGDDRFGQLGRGEISELPRAPGPSLAMPPVIALAAGGSSTCALDESGAVFCFGLGRHGQIGDGTLETRARPTRVAMLLPATAISIGSDHACAIAASDVYCWGWNGTGQAVPTLRPRVGGDPIDVLVPTRVEGLPPVDRVVAGYLDTCAFTHDGEVFCWGQMHEAPTSIGRARAVAVGVDHLCLVRDDTTTCFGAEPGGGRPALPMEGVTFSLAGEHAAGAVDHVCVLDDVGSLSCWGKNEHGQLGLGSQRFVESPEIVPFDRPLRAVGVGVAFSCALTDDDVACWGDNEHGELGEPGALDAFSPLLVPRW